MPFTRELIKDETHPRDVLYRESSLGPIRVVIHLGEYVDDSLHVLSIGVVQVVLLVEVATEGVCQDHLADSDGAAPTDVIVDAYLDHSVLFKVDGAQEQFYLCYIIV